MTMSDGDSGRRLEGMAEFFKRRVDGYEEHMLRYVDGADRYYAETARVMRRLVAGGHMLDLGAGTGLELEGIYARNPELNVTCVDMCRDMLERLAAKYAGHAPEIVVGDYFTVELGQGRFDAALAVETLHHFSRADKLRLYRRIRDALKPGAPFVDTDYMAPDDAAEAANFAELERLRRAQGIGDGWVHYDTPLTARHEIETLLEAGFSSAREVWRCDNTAIILARR